MSDMYGKSRTYWSCSTFCAVTTNAEADSRASAMAIALFPAPVGASIITKRLPAARASRARTSASCWPGRYVGNGKVLTGLVVYRLRATRQVGTAERGLPQADRPRVMVPRRGLEPLQPNAA